MDSQRKAVVEKLNSIFKEDISKKIENGIYNFCDEYANLNDTSYLLEYIYNTKSEEIIALLNNKESLHLLKSLQNKTIVPEKLAYMKPEELNPEKYEQIIKKRELEEFKKNNGASSDAFTCTKCKKSKCKIEQKQTRAGDEPPTTFVTCLECNHTFKF
jgi:DNA-directed RNA polymerase subunit M/transcription elongation factor TFIIS